MEQATQPGTSIRSNAPRWYQIYFAAILESDQSKAALLIESAQGAIRDRLAELRAAPPANSREGQDLDSALMYLGILLDHMGQESGSLLWDPTA